MTNQFKDKVVWVVGAAGALGEATSLHLAAQGARVVLSGRSPAALEAVGQKLGASDASLVAPLDVRSSASVKKTLESVLLRTGRIDYLVNTPTLPLFGDLLELDDDAWTAVLDTKIIGYVRTMRAVLPHFVGQGHGAIVNISGRGGRQPKAIHLPGGAANAAVNLITKGVADQYGGRGIRVNAVAPGPINSVRHAALAAAGASQTHEVEGQPADVAAAVAFLLSDAARFINGTVLAVDGGSLATV